MEMHNPASPCHTHGIGAAPQQPNSVLDWLRAIAGWISETRRWHHSASALRRMDDRMLRDLGLCRGDIEAAVRGTTWRR